jgi:hypothetical protein
LNMTMAIQILDKIVLLYSKKVSIGNNMTTVKLGLIFYKK